MAVEIERKFLVIGDAWRSGSGVCLCQGYLNRDIHRTVRVRIAGPCGFLTIKGLTKGASRVEFEYAIPLHDAQALLQLCDGSLVEKTRYTVHYRGFDWEVDEFKGENHGLVVAEIELQCSDQPFERPTWIGQEVTEDHRYSNSHLSTNPFQVWPGTA